MIVRIFVNRNHLTANTKDGGNRPVVSVKTETGTEWVHEVEIDGPSRLVYRPNDPMPCGTRVWIETEAPVRVRK